MAPVAGNRHAVFTMAQGTVSDHSPVSPLSKPSQKISPLAPWSPKTPVLRSLTLRIGQSARPGSARPVVSQA